MNDRMLDWLPNPMPREIEVDALVTGRDRRKRRAVGDFENAEEELKVTDECKEWNE